MRKLLIANRGEIARRVIRTARRMGIETVAVYSDVDRDAPHVRDADEAVHIGPAPAAESYLLIDRIIDAARRTGADAVHPGYGFLSENAKFARALDEAGIIFVGPRASSIERMGLKDAAKALMKKAGVPVTPGYQGEDQSLQRLEKAAKSVSYPLLIKAVAGGGGKGMRRVDNEAEFAEALIAAKREGEASFGNDNVLIEKLIQRPRHVEVQVFGDTHGNVVHLFERDCSLQRRHQKVVEEAPAPGLSERTRRALGQAAVRAAGAIDYVGAGTIEFILDTEAADDRGDHPFYFMEMNTRLQVEHPVTELITGTDLVEWQIRVARGETLPRQQEELSVSGHAVEARLYAEDPASGFLPSTGTLDRLSFPKEAGGVRIDSGVEQGGAVTVHYDPMIAKIIACGPSRGAAIDRLVTALDAAVVEGVKTNRAFLARLIDDEEFRSGAVHTGLIETKLDELTQPPAASAVAAAVAALALTLPRGAIEAPTRYADFAGWRMNLPARRYVDLFPLDSEPVHLVLKRQDGGYAVSGVVGPNNGAKDGASDAVREVSGRWRDDTHLEAVVDGKPLLAIIVADEDSLEVRIDGEARRYGISAAAADGAAGGDGAITAPMPGRVLSLFVEEGKTVAAGDRLLVLEAMKMENRLTAPIAGQVTGLAVAEGDQVSEGTLLLTIEPEE